MSFKPFVLKPGDRKHDLNAIGVRITVLASGSDIQDQQITEQSGAEGAVHRHIVTTGTSPFT